MEVSLRRLQGFSILGVSGSGVLYGFYLGSCQNYGPFLGTLNNRVRIIIGTQKGTIILTTAHLRVEGFTGGWFFFHSTPIRPLYLIGVVWEAYGKLPT